MDKYFRMLFSIVAFVVVQTTFASDYIPVLLWESGSSEPSTSLSAFKKISEDAFRNSILNNAHKDLILVFAEENLSIEDFVWKNDAGIGSFPKLDNLTSEMSLSSKFHPAVENPIQTLLEGEEWEHIPISADLPSILTTRKHPPFVFVPLNDAADSEDRPHMLQRHDTVIADAFRAVRSTYDKVMVIYSGYHSSWVPVRENNRQVRSLLATAEENIASDFINAENKVHMYTSQSPVFNTPSESIILENRTDAYIIETPDSQDIKMVVVYDEAGHNLTVTYNFPESPAGYWILDQVTVERVNNNISITSETPENMQTTTVTLIADGVTAPYGFSYHCSEDTIYEEYKGKHSLVFKDFQVEAFPPSPGQFSKAYDCVYFFTIPILSGILVSIILILILSSGITMLLDIKTMDRFDDPKGKTITINATE